MDGGVVKKWFNTTTKALTWLIVLNGEIQIYLSYALGFMGRENALETLAVTIVAEIMAPLGLLFIKTCIENIFEKNKIFPKESSGTTEDGGAL